MSGKLMGEVYEYEFSHGQQSVLLAMADHAQDDGSHCFPSVRRLAWKTGYDKRHVKRLMSELRDVKVLVEVRAATPHHPTEYRIHLAVATHKPPFEPNSTGGDIPAEGGGNGASGVTPRPPEPSLEPPIEPTTTDAELADEEVGEPDDVGEALAAAELGGAGQVRMSVGGDEDIDALVGALWTYYVELFEPARPKLTPSRARAIKKGFKEEFTLDDLKLAVLGLKLWRKTKSGDESISTLFTTYPGGQTLADRIAFFIDVAEKAGPTASVTSADPAILQQKQLDVQRGHRSTSPELVQAAEEAEEWLRQHGIQTARDGDGYPTFHVNGGGGA
jgi:hypothetical protein